MEAMLFLFEHSPQANLVVHQVGLLVASKLLYQMTRDLYWTRRRLVHSDTYLSFTLWETLENPAFIFKHGRNPHVNLPY